MNMTFGKYLATSINAVRILKKGLSQISLDSMHKKHRLARRKLLFCSMSNVLIKLDITSYIMKALLLDVCLNHTRECQGI